jgi:hypothetical protein
MKTLIATFALLTALTASAEISYMSVKLDTFTASGKTYYASQTMNVATNTLVTLVNWQQTGVKAGNITVTYPGQPTIIFTPGKNLLLNVPVLGPCTVTVTAASKYATANLVVLTVKIEDVTTFTP